MRLERVDTRFYKSFNFDYERKWEKGREPQPWEDVADGWYPFIRIKTDDQVTAVVGANESGKSQFLGAVEAALTGRGINASDFCRYSALYSVEAGRVRAPEFGASFVVEDEEDLSALASLIPGAGLGQRFTLYRPGTKTPFVLIPSTQERVELDPAQVTALTAALPPIFKLDTHLGMPDMLSIDELGGMAHASLHSRKRRASLMSTIAESSWPGPAEFGAGVFSAWQNAISGPDTELEQRRAAEFELGRKLLVDIARIEPESFIRLQKAIDDEREGEIEGIVGAMNIAIAENLNFQRWWSQDPNFEIQVKARERELALVIRDRTRASYSFDERSQGLRYFLSYFVQLTAHREGLSRNEVMLLDEPDAFLSSSGQQDLLRVLQDYATPEHDGPKNQVIYVTHSPFLIDRNAGHRVRVLDKGAEDEGTRLVKDATQNHYEPLRSSLGPSVAETAFIGGANLFVEGIADQVLLAGMSTHLTRTRDDADYLDLNKVTIVPSGSASSIPYMVFLARGRDQVKPACVALFDGDKAGKDAANALRHGLVSKKRLLPEECVFELDSWVATARVTIANDVLAEEIEDLIDPAFAVKAAQANAKLIEGIDDNETAKLTLESLQAQLAIKKSLWNALVVCYSKAFKGGHIEKLGFAREVVDLMSHKDDAGSATPGRAITEDNFALLLTSLSSRLRDAQEEETSHRSERRLSGKIREFERDHHDGISKRRALSLIREIDLILDQNDEADHVRVELGAIAREFALNEQISLPVANFEQFKTQIQRLSVAQRLESQASATNELQERSALDG
jgi:predicted ATPase